MRFKFDRLNRPPALTDTVPESARPLKTPRVGPLLSPYLGQKRLHTQAGPGLVNVLRRHTKYNSLLPRETNAPHYAAFF